MRSIYENLLKLQTSVSAIKDAIVRKGGVVNGDVSTFANSIRDMVTTNVVIQSSEVVRDVNFYDCDGTILYSYSKDEFINLNNMPTLPTRKGLICQEWNWDFEDAKQYVRNYGCLEIGATYITDDGKTRFYIKINNIVDYNHIELHFVQSHGNCVVVNWGDGSPEETFSGLTVNCNHKYTKTGNYVITLDPLAVRNDCTITLGADGGVTRVFNYINESITSSSKIYSVRVLAAEFGSNLELTKNVLNSSCLRYISLPNYITAIKERAFAWTGLNHITIPKNVTQIEDTAFCGNGYSSSNSSVLQSVSLPKNLNHIGENAFHEQAIRILTLPPSLTKINRNSFSSNYLERLILPEGIEYIGDIYTTTTTNSSTQLQCFANADSLNKLILPETIKGIGTYAFYNSTLLNRIVWPTGIEHIGISAFSNCDVSVHDFRSAKTIPNIYSEYMPEYPSSNALGVKSSSKIVVPDNLYDAWITAENWSSYADLIVKASLFNE